MRISDWSSDVCSSDLWFNGAVGGGLAGVAVQLYRNAIEQAKPDAERESGFQERDAPRMEGRLKSMDKRYDAKVDKAIMALRLQRYASRVPAGQRIPELDEWLGIGAGDKAIPGLDAKLDAPYAGSKLGDEAQRLQLWQADKATVDASGYAALQFAATVIPANLRLYSED